LSGYTDGDGNFNINISQRKNGQTRISLSFNIESKQLSNTNVSVEQGGSSFSPIFTKISLFFRHNFIYESKNSQWKNILYVFGESTQH